MSTVISLQEWLASHPDNSLTNQQLFLSEEQVRTFPKFKDASPEEIENIIGTIHDLALISYELFCKETTENKTLNEAA